MSNVDYKKKYFKLKGLVAKSLGAIERISDLDQMEGGAGVQSAEIVSASGNLDTKSSELKTKLQGFVKGLQDSNEEAATTFNEKMGEQAGTILSKLVNVADELIKTVGNLQEATSQEITEYTTKLSTSANNVLTQVNSNLEALQKEVSVSNLSGGDKGCEGDHLKGHCSGDDNEEDDEKGCSGDHLKGDCGDNLIGGYTELTFYDN